MDERELRQHLNAIYEYVTKDADARDEEAQKRHTEVMQGLKTINTTLEHGLRELASALRVGAHV